MATTHTIRNNKGGLSKVSLTASSAIRAFCYECMGWNYYEVDKCTDPHCPLYPWRNPTARKGAKPVSEKAIKALKKATREKRESQKSNSEVG